jgi:hypothetical protein
LLAHCKPARGERGVGHVRGDETAATKFQIYAIQHVTTETGSERLRCSLERTLETKRCHGGLCGARNEQRGEEANRDITAGRDSLYVVLMSLFILKSVIEERFLRDNPEYAAYMRQVRYRWIQGVA